MTFTCRLSFVALTLLVGAPPAAPLQAQTTTDLDELRAFTRLYGFVRYFHPSDQAAELDWDAFAVYGAREVVKAETREDLEAALERLFRPAAPTLDVYPQGEQPRSKADLFPPDTEDLEIVFWQHSGLGAPNNVYESRRVVSSEDGLFEARPEAEEMLQESLGSGLEVRLPLVLYRRDGKTLGPPGEPIPPLPELATGELSPDDPAVGTAAGIVAWNVFQHFYPYFDETGVDWPGVLDATLVDLRDDSGHDEALESLRRMVAKAQDGHGFVIPARQQAMGMWPVRLARVEGRLVVREAKTDSGFEPGDVVVQIDGEPVEDVYARRETFLSGAAPWRRMRLLERGFLTVGPAGSTLDVTVRRGEETKTVEAVRLPENPPQSHSLEPVEILADGVAYVDLRRIEWKDLEKRLGEIAEAPGVVFDVRGYPTDSGARILSHLVRTPADEPWMFVPRILYPDRERLAGWQEHSWNIQPAEPHIPGPVVWMTNGGAISYAESVLGFVKPHGLGEIVGVEPTAGTNGNVNPVVLPGGFRMLWTGMEVRRHDGSRFHLLGIEPTVWVERTLEGVREGRDEVLERALEVVRGGG